MLKHEILSVFRSLGLMHFVDDMHFLFNKVYYYNKNRKFISSNQKIKLPPSYLVYESYVLDFEDYFNGGLQNAELIKNEISDYIALDNINILDWGCGPARVVRHLPTILKQDCKVYATDYNKQTIDWCKKNIKNVEFSLNGIEPPLAFPNKFFDLVYGLSVFTHLSKSNHKKWLNELSRIIKSNGILYITTQGAVFEEKLTTSEKKVFKAGDLVERCNVKEGHRTFCAFHPSNYMRELFSSEWKILKFKAGKKQSWGYEQDTWILQRAG